MNGLEFLKALRAKGNETPFGFTTTDCIDGVRESAKEAGASFFITKPFKPEKIELEIKSLVQA